MKFLETLTFLGNDILIPIDRIEYIVWRVNEKGCHEINIKGEGKFEWVEIFDTREKAEVRYNMIKKIIEAE